jgi:hypothetical protein
MKPMFTASAPFCDFSWDALPELVEHFPPLLHLLEQLPVAIGGFGEEIVEVEQARVPEAHCPAAGVALAVETAAVERVYQVLRLLFLAHVASSWWCRTGNGKNRLTPLTQRVLQPITSSFSPR